MRIILVGLVLLSACAFGYSQSDSQNGTIVFYAADSGRSTVSPVVYSDHRRLGEVTKDHFVRVVVSPGVHYFALSDNEPPKSQLGVSIGSGQTIYLRVTANGFFYGNETEAKAVMQQLDGVKPASAPVADIATTGATFESTNLKAATPSTTTPSAVHPILVDTKDGTSSSTIFFYRSNESRDSNESVTIYGLFVAGSRPLATLQKGEYFAVKVTAGVRAFSWTVKPARGQQVFMNVSAGENVYNEVRSSSILPTSETKATAVITQLRSVDPARVFDDSVLVAAPVVPLAVAGQTVSPSTAGQATLKDSIDRGRGIATSPQSDTAKRIDALMNVEQDETEVTLGAILLPSATTADLNQLLDESVESRNGRIAQLKDDLGEKSSTTIIREILIHLQARNEFMRAYKNYLQQVDLLLAFDQAAPDVIFDSYENECRNAVGSSRGTTALINCEADRAKAELAAREAKVAAAKKRAAAAWSSIVSDETGLTRKLDQNGLDCPILLGNYSKDVLNHIK